MKTTITGHGDGYKRPGDTPEGDGGKQKRTKLEKQAAILGKALREAGFGSPTPTGSTSRSLELEADVKKAEATAINAEANATVCKSLQSFIECPAVDPDDRKKAMEEWKKKLGLS